MKAIDPLLFEYLPIEVMHLLDGGIGHPGHPILTPESCPQRFKLLLFCRVIKAHVLSSVSEKFESFKFRKPRRAAAAGFLLCFLSSKNAQAHILRLCVFALSVALIKN